MAVPSTIFFDPNNTPITAGKKALKDSAEPSKTAASNKALWGSETVDLRSDAANNGQLFWHSSLTNNDYPSADAALAAENDYRNKTGQYAPGAGIVGNIHDDPMTAATGAQAPTENPNGDLINQTNQIVAGLSPPAAPAAPAPRPAVARPGFTNETPVVPTRAVAARPKPSSPYDSIDPSGANFAPYQPAPGAGGGAGPSIDTSNPGSPAPTINRDQIDKILDPLSGYQNDIAALAGDNTGLSLAEAQLNKADALAKIRARDELAANQAGALGAARSARNAGDRRLLERQAVGEQAYLGSQAQRQDVLRQAELEGNLASLRAQEEDADRRFKLDALTKASDLGLNRGALEVDIGKADLASATNWINQEFQQLGLDKQLGQSAEQFAASLTEDRVKTILGFTQAMAAIQYQYDQLSVTDQNAADALLMQKYGIDQQTMVALKKIKQDGRFRWDNVLTALVGGAATGGTGAIASTLLGSGGSGGAGGSSGGGSGDSAGGPGVFPGR